MQPLDVMIEAHKRGLEVEWVENAIAYRSGNKIYLNINLPKYEAYCRYTLDHEFRHSTRWTWKDLYMDLTEGSFKENLKFIRNHPKCLKQLIPFGRNNDGPYIDINMIIIYLMFIGITALIGGFILSKI